MSRESKSEAYGAFAYAYDQGLGETFFRAIRRLLADALTKYPAPPTRKTHLDVACGTGLAIDFFAKNGFVSTGVDASVAMLGVARKRAKQLVAGDFLALPFRSTFTRVTCLYDSLNHLKEREELVAAFRAIAGVMHRDSLFLFDMNHPDIYPAVWGMKQPYVATGPDYHLEIATKHRTRERIGVGLVTGWSKMPNGERVQIRETHEQRAYSERDITRSLEEGGLEVVELIDFDPFQEIDTVDAQGVKLFYIVKRAEQAARI